MFVGLLDKMISVGDRFGSTYSVLNIHERPDNQHWIIAHQKSRFVISPETFNVKISKYVVRKTETRDDDKVTTFILSAPNAPNPHFKTGTGILRSVQHIVCDKFVTCIYNHNTLYHWIYCKQWITFFQNELILWTWESAIIILYSKILALPYFVTNLSNFWFMNLISIIAKKILV